MFKRVPVSTSFRTPEHTEAVQRFSAALDRIAMAGADVSAAYSEAFMIAQGLHHQFIMDINDFREPINAHLGLLQAQLVTEFSLPEFFWESDDFVSLFSNPLQWETFRIPESAQELLRLAGPSESEMSKETLQFITDFKESHDGAEPDFDFLSRMLQVLCLYRLICAIEIELFDSEEDLCTAFSAVFTDVSTVLAKTPRTVRRQELYLKTPKAPDALRLDREEARTEQRKALREDRVAALRPALAACVSPEVVDPLVPLYDMA